MTDPVAVEPSDLDDFLDKWRGRWPEWRIARVFVPEAQHAAVEAWCALLQEWTDAAWAGDDATPGAAKLGWWREELTGWSKGLRRHPLGRVLQKTPAPWATLAMALPALQAVREPLRAWAPPAGVLPTLQPLAEALSAAEAALFGADRPAAADGFALLAAHVGWSREDAGEAARARDWARALATRTPAPAATRARRVHDALVLGRLRRFVASGEVLPLPPMAALWRSWRAARG
jgi:hypothetical protein